MGQFQLPRALTLRPEKICGFIWGLSTALLLGYRRKNHWLSFNGLTSQMVHAFHCYLNLSVPECESNKTLNDIFLPFISSPSNPHLFLLFFFLFGRTESFPKKNQGRARREDPLLTFQLLSRRLSRYTGNSPTFSQSPWTGKAPCLIPPTKLSPKTGPPQAPTFKPYSPPFLPKSFRVSTYSA